MANPSSHLRPLTAYQAKRDFSKTTEPSDQKSAKAARYRYFIQKHAARRLHYDFRLEMDGTLKSWAVTRGPSLNPADKRLAVHVEDHPLDYGKFEGTIPQGQYGGGTVMLWDEGSWAPTGDARNSYKKGRLDFELRGKRLRGQWHLVRMGMKPHDAKHENWLLIKGKDIYAKENGDYALERYQKSIISNRSMKAIGDTKKKNFALRIKTIKAAPKEKTKAKPPSPRNSSLLPDFIPPQLATLVKVPPWGRNWIHEIKFDGYRLLARIENGKVRLMTRANNDWTAKFKSMAMALAELDADNAFLDGEAVSMGDDGTMSFHGLQQALSTGDHSSIHYYIFDLLYLNGADWRGRPLLERKKKLQALLKQTPSSLHYSEHFSEPGEKVLTHACQIALEGIISKRADAAYHSGRDELWVKSKCSKEQEAVIGGFTMQPKHKGELGALLTGIYSKGELIFSGKTGTGFSHEEGRALVKKLQKLQRKTSPFKSIPAASKKGAQWVDPNLVAQIHFAEWTPDGMMRHPSFQGLREDKPACEVVHETEKQMPDFGSRKTPASKAAHTKKSGNEKDDIAGVTLTHPDKKLYAGDTITKRDLALYYEKIAPLMLPHIAGRPISLLRCPEGEGKPCFFQRHGSESLSPYVKAAHIPGDKQPYLMIEDVRGLIALAQMGVLEIHVWSSMADTPERPDQLVFDLDPAPGLGFTEVKKAALDIRKRLQKLKLVSFLKTTGGKGLHVVVPFQKGPTWEQAKDFARALAQLMAKEAPDRFTANNRKDVRTGKIYIDYLRNGKGASAVAPYSTRARKGAPIAVPVEWDQLKTLKSGADFTLHDAGKVAKKNPWKKLGQIKQRLV